MTINPARTVRDVVLEVPASTRVFEKLGIDYCCGGGKSLEEASQSAGVKLEEVIGRLEEAAQANQSSDQSQDWLTEPLTSLIGHIVDTHHHFTREEMARLGELLAKVCTVHGTNHPELLAIQGVFHALNRELLTHMMKEEQVLFPYVVNLEEARQSGRPAPPCFFGTVRNPIRMMMMEHDAAGDMLREIRTLGSDFKVPADACISYQTLYQALEALERDLHQHIHLENNILFPRAVEMEAEA
jgi:regulator of cell morphogenesis and NO signaling